MTRPMPANDAIHVWTDGSCQPNPGKGGWAVIMQMPDGSERDLSGSEANTTNNRMELIAAIQALEALPEGCSVVIHTDSQYVSEGITKWLPSWQRSGWRKSDGKPVLNANLWARLIEAESRRRVEWRWVRGHADAEMNVRADALANAAREGLS